MEDIVIRLKRLAQCVYDGNSFPQESIVSLLRDAAEEIITLRKARDDPQWDATDAAHPAFFRGSSHSVWQAIRLVVDILSGTDTGTSAMYEPASSLRNLVLDLKRKSDLGWDRVHELEEENGALFEKLTLAEERLSGNE